jgi:hypothetical protein
MAKKGNNLAGGRERGLQCSDPVVKRLPRPQSFVAKYEGGERRVDVVEFIEICKAIEADPNELLKVRVAYRLLTLSSRR